MVKQGLGVIKYFAYGSNMLEKKLKDRCSSAEKINPSEGSQHMIRKYRFRFHKKSSDGSAKCDARKTGDTSDIVYGVLFSINDEQIGALNKFEGLHYGYEKKVVNVIDEKSSNEISALIYYATDIDPTLKPYDWYKRQTVKGARDNGLPEEYVKEIESFESKTDEDEVRKKREEKLLE